MAQRKKWDPERMEAAIETIRNKEMYSCKASRVFNVLQTTLERYVKDRKRSSSKTLKTKLGRKQDFMTTAQEGGKFFSPAHRPHLRSENPPGTHFC